MIVLKVVFHFLGHLILKFNMSMGRKSVHRQYQKEAGAI
jgi:hypothetical protein